MTPFNEYWLETGAAVPVDIETTAILLREIQRLRSKEQKPVAFRNIETGDFCTGGFLRKDWTKWQPLYAAPVHASENAEKQEPVAWIKEQELAYMSAGAGIGDVAADQAMKIAMMKLEQKREWVGLDPEMMRNTSLEFNRGALWAERYLAEKQKPVAFINIETGDFCTNVRKDWAKWQPLYAAPVHASDISQERVDETEKDRHEPVAHLWECLGRWSAYLASHGGEAELAPPQWLCDAINAATAPPKREWVGLTKDEVVGLMALDGASLADFVRCIEAKLKEKNT